jgi:shikimate kinase
MMEQKNNNIILIGMPGVGKSTVGVVLAKILGYHFVDADIVIQQKDGRLLKDIIAEEGVDGFIEIENKINSEINGKKTIIATGGSVIYGKEAMEHYKQIGSVIYLKLDYDTLINRLGDIKNRGVVLKDGQTLKDLYDERCKLYEKYADIVVDEAGLDVEKTIDRLVENLQK